MLSEMTSLEGRSCRSAALLFIARPLCFPAEESGVSLLQLIGDPLPEEVTRSYMPNGESAYVFTSAAVSGQPAVAHVPNPFHRHFSLLFHVKPSTPAAAVLFSITDGPQRIMYIAVKLGAVRSGRQRVQLFYTEPDAEASYEAASFEVPSMVGAWNRFSLAVYEERVTFYYGCDSVPQVLKFERSPDPMELDAGAGIFVGQAGGADGDKFQVPSSIIAAADQVAAVVCPRCGQKTRPRHFISNRCLTN